jgi:hypothetical protein
VQTASHTARLAINTYKTTPADNLAGTVTEPWQYPSHTPFIRDAIRRRYALLPLLASLQIEAHRTGAPPVRWVGWGCESSDPEVWSSQRLRDGEPQFRLGDSLMVVAVDQAADECSFASVYLPRGGAHCALASSSPSSSSGDDDDGEGGDATGYVLLAGDDFPRFPAGRWARVPCPIARGAPVLTREGGAVPIGRGERTRGPADDAGFGDGGGDGAVHVPPDDFRGVEVYPPLPPASSSAAAAAADEGEDGDEDEDEDGGRWFTTTWREDDGLGPDHARSVLACTVSYLSLPSRILLRYSEEHEACCPDAETAPDARFQPAWTQLAVVMPPNDFRPVVAAAGAPAVLPTEDVEGLNRRLTWLVNVER